MGHIITAQLSQNGKDFTLNTEAWQYDYGSYLEIKGVNLPTITEVHFSVADHGGTAETRTGKTADGTTTVMIPNRLLKTPSASDYNIYAYIYLTSEESGNTEYKICIPVHARPKPSEEIPDSDKDHPLSGVVKELNRLDKEKLNNPVSPVAGQILRVKTINDDGTIVLETVEAAGSGISDVQINGTSVVDESVANIPIASKTAYGAVKLAGQGVVIIGGSLFTERAERPMIDARNYYYQPITPAYLDYAVKAAMSDGKGEAWTETEQIAARERIGTHRGFEFIGGKGVDKALTVSVRVDVPNFAEYDAIFFRLFTINEHSSAVSYRVNITDDTEIESLTYSGVGVNHSANLSGMLFPLIDNHGVKCKHRLYGFYSMAENASAGKTFDDPYDNGLLNSIIQNNTTVTFETAKAIIFTCPAPFSTATKVEVWGRKK